MAHAGARAPEKNPGTRRRTSARTVQEVLKIRAVGLTVVTGVVV